jgi:hypothetical protein
MGRTSNASTATRYSQAQPLISSQKIPSPNKNDSKVDKIFAEKELVKTTFYRKSIHQNF